MRRIVSRHGQLPSVPLPFFVRSVGYNEASYKWHEEVPGERKNFFQLFWTLEGRGQVITEYAKFQVGPGWVFFQLPGEKHDHQCISPGKWWRYYWLTLDGTGGKNFFLAYGFPNTGFYAGECPSHLFLELESRLKKRTHYAERHAISLAAEMVALAGGRLEEPKKFDLVKEFIQQAH